MTLLIVVSAAFGLIASIALVALTLKWAHRRQLLDHPNERSLHERPTPRGGGIGIVVPVVAAICVAAVSLPDVSIPATWIAAVATCLAVLGFLDDVRNLSAVVRLVIQVVASVAFVWAVGAWTIVVIPGVVPLDLGRAAAGLTVLFLVWIINAYNFMDGIDGIAGAQGLAAGLGWVAVGYQMNDPLIAVAGGVVAFACLGFLFFNWSPASIFMGDVGTGFLGFLFGGLTVYVATRSPAAATAGVLFVWPFLFDTIFTIIRRAMRGEYLLRAHRSHLYQRLVLSGYSHRAITTLYLALAAAGVLAGYTVLEVGRGPAIAAPAIITALAVGLWRFVVYREHRRSIAK